jgi:hypothetical protein
VERAGMTDLTPEEKAAFWGDDDVAGTAAPEPMTLRDHALAAAALGFHVFPLLPNRKVPPKGMTFKTLATRDREQITKWWTENPNYNIGIYAGRYRDDKALLILDPDQKHGKDGLGELARLKAEGFELPLTRTVETPTGGQHLYFRVPQAVRQGALAPDVDVRSSGGYVVGPGSIIDGVPYTVLHDVAIADAPEWLVTKCGPTPDKLRSDRPEPDATDAATIKRAVAFLEAHPPAIEGQGGDLRTYKTGCRLWDFGVDRVTARDLMMDHWNERCEPPWTLEDMQTKVWNAYDHANLEFGNADPRKEFTVWRPKRITLSEILKRTAQPVEYIIPGLIQKSIVNALDGPGGSHKSRFAMQIGLVAAAGAMMLGEQATKCTPVHLSSEDDMEELTRRSQDISRRLALTPDREMVFWDRTGEDSTIVEASEGGVIKLPPFYDELRADLLTIGGHKLLILDSLPDYVRYHGKAKLDEGAVNAVIKGPLTRLCQECDTTILTIRHPSQSGQERGDQSGWSVAHTNSIRSRLSLVRVERGKDTFTLTREKTNHAAAGKTWTLTYSEGALLPPDQLQVAEQSTRVYDAVVKVAIAEALAGQPFKDQKHPLPSQINSIEQVCGVRPTIADIRDKLSIAVRAGRLKYQKGYGKNQAGYFPAVETG